MLVRGEITEGHARAVLAVPDDDARRRLARKIARDGMTVRAAEKAAQDGGARRRRHGVVGRSRARRARTRRRDRLTGLPARVSAGRLELHFGDETGLEELVEVARAPRVRARPLSRALGRRPAARTRLHCRSREGD